jgi:GntR family transcriptional regulator
LGPRRLRRQSQPDLVVAQGLVIARPGVGTFVTRTLTDQSLAAHGPLREELRAWLAGVRAAGLAAESIEALFVTTFRTPIEETT